MSSKTKFQGRKRSCICCFAERLSLPIGWSGQLMHPEGMGVRRVQVSVAASEWLHHQPPTVIHHAGPASEESQPQQGAEPSNISLNKVTTGRFVPMINLVNNCSTSPFFVPPPPFKHIKHYESSRKASLLTGLPSPLWHFPRVFSLKKHTQQHANYKK